MDRRRFIQTAAAGSTGLALAACAEDTESERSGGRSGAGPAVQTKKRELRMVTTWVKGFPGLGTAAERVARRIGELTGGTLTVKLFGAGELVDAFGAYDAVISGSADMYHGAEYYWQGKHPGFAFFTGVPFGMTTVEHTGWMRYGGGQALWEELSSDFGVISFLAGSSGHQLGGWYRTKIESLDDMRGLTIRMPGLGGEVISRLGATPKLLSGGEIYQALQTGAIDGTEWVGPWNDLAYGFYKEAPYYAWPGFHEPGTALACGMNLEVWNTLSATQQAAVRYACQSVHDEAAGEFAMMNARALKTLTEEHGVEMVRLPDEVLRAAAEASRDVLQRTAQRDEMSRRIHDSFRKALIQLSAWSRVGDEAFLDARRRYALAD